MLKSENYFKVSETNKQLSEAIPEREYTGSIDFPSCTNFVTDTASTWSMT